MWICVEWVTIWVGVMWICGVGNCIGGCDVDLLGVVTVWVGVMLICVEWVTIWVGVMWICVEWVTVWVGVMWMYLEGVTVIKRFTMSVTQSAAVTQTTVPMTLCNTLHADYHVRHWCGSKDPNTVQLVIDRTAVLG
jgi:hypothetical protein